MYRIVSKLTKCGVTAKANDTVTIATEQTAGLFRQAFEILPPQKTNPYLAEAIEVRRSFSRRAIPGKKW